MYTVDEFEFMTSTPERVDVTIDQSTQNKQELLLKLARGLSFPDYFGNNWDALIDCLSDLSWSTATEAIIHHASLPSLTARDLRLYLESLIDAANRRAADTRPKLRLVFRAQDRAAVTAALIG